MIGAYYKETYYLWYSWSSLEFHANIKKFYEHVHVLKMWIFIPFFFQIMIKDLSAFSVGVFPLARISYYMLVLIYAIHGLSSNV